MTCLRVLSLTLFVCFIQAYPIPVEKEFAGTIDKFINQINQINARYQKELMELGRQAIGQYIKSVVQSPEAFPDDECYGDDEFLSDEEEEEYNPTDSEDEYGIDDDEFHGDKEEVEYDPTDSEDDYGIDVVDSLKDDKGEEEYDPTDSENEYDIENSEFQDDKEEEENDLNGSEEEYSMGDQECQANEKEEEYDPSYCEFLYARESISDDQEISHKQIESFEKKEIDDEPKINSENQEAHYVKQEADSD